MYRLTVEIKSDDLEHGEFKKGEMGVIDGYVRGADGRPYAIVCIKDRLIMIDFHLLKVL